MSFLLVLSHFGSFLLILEVILLILFTIFVGYQNLCPAYDHVERKGTKVWIKQKERKLFIKNSD
jgi:hypothetical protein